MKPNYTFKLIEVFGGIVNSKGNQVGALLEEFNTGDPAADYMTACKAFVVQCFKAKPVNLLLYWNDQVYHMNATDPEAQTKAKRAVIDLMIGRPKAAD